MIVLDLIVGSGSAFALGVDYTDDNGAEAVPTSVSYTLKDGKGQVIRDSVPVLPGSDIVVTDTEATGPPDELKTVDGQIQRLWNRYLQIEVIGNTSYGSNIPTVKEYFFQIEDSIL